tara:strand:+ start:942 stop:1148 length:207 start_codon:yes stop_codon:yes gene_type:complete
MNKFDMLSEVDWHLRRVKELHQDALLKLQQAMSQEDRSMEGYLRGKETGLDVALMHLELLHEKIKAEV